MSSVIYVSIKIASEYPSYKFRRNISLCIAGCSFDIKEYGNLKVFGSQFPMQLQNFIQIDVL